MNWLRINNIHNFISIVFLSVLFSACLNENRPYLGKSADDWEAYFNDISGEQLELSKSVLLVLKSKECEPCIDEMKWWNEIIKNPNSVNVYMVIIEKYETTFKAFMGHNDLNIAAFQDKAGLVIDKELVPTTPVKIFIDQDGDVAYLETIHINSDPAEFYSKITALKHIKIIEKVM